MSVKMVSSIVYRPPSTVYRLGLSTCHEVLSVSLYHAYKSCATSRDTLQACLRVSGPQRVRSRELFPQTVKLCQGRRVFRAQGERPDNHT